MAVSPEETALLPVVAAGTAAATTVVEEKALLDVALPSVSVKSVEADDDHLASDGRTFVNAVVSFLGTGVLGFSSAFMKTGMLLGVALLLAVGTLSVFCMLLLVDCKYKLQRRGVAVRTYGDIGRHALGHGGQRVVDTALVLAQMGFAIGFLIFVSTNIHTYFGVAKPVVIAVSVPFLIGFALIKHINQLAYVALAASVMNLSGLVVVYATDFSFIDMESPSALLDEVAALNWLGTLSATPFFFGVATYCFSGIGMVLPLENSMQHKQHFPRILITTVGLVGFIYASFGICGYVAFGSDTQDVLLWNLRGQSVLATAVDVLFCASVFFGYPIMLFPVFDALQHKVIPADNSSKNSRTTELRIAAFRATLVGITALIAATVPNFVPFISFVGSTCCSLLGFVLPVVFYLRLSVTDTLSVTRRWLLLGVMGLGVLALLAGVGNAVNNMF